MSYHPAKFGGLRHFDSEDIVISVCHVILQDHVIKRYGQEPAKVSYHHAKFGGDRHCGNRDIMILGCHVISKDQKSPRDQRIM